MSDVYVQFCEALVLKNDEEARWAAHHLEVIGKVEESNDPESHPNYSESEYMRKDLYILDDCEYIDFRWNFHNNGRGHKVMYLYSDESGNIEHAATFVQEYLKKFDPEESFSFCWSNTSSSSRAGEFGGGAVFITADKMEWTSLWDWVDKKKKEFEQRMKSNETELHQG